MSPFFSFQNQDWEKLAEICPAAPKNYWDFPFTMMAFCNGLKNSKMEIVENCVFRIRGKQRILVNWFCSGTELKNILNRFPNQKIKTLNFIDKDTTGFEVQKNLPEFLIKPGWGWDFISQQKTSGRGRYKIRKIAKMESLFTIKKNPGLDECLEVFDEWVQGASLRHFMVVKGHYLEYLKSFFKNRKNSHLLGFRAKDGLLFGFCGFELFNGAAQMTLMKHRFSDDPALHYFPKFFWISSLVNILSHKPSIVFCGSTANKLKQELEMEKVNSYKLVLP